MQSQEFGKNRKIDYIKLYIRVFSGSMLVHVGKYSLMNDQRVSYYERMVAKGE